MISKKICMLGAFAVGKTSLVGRFVRSMFSEQYQTTIGVKIEKKSLDLDGKAVNLMIWDLAGEDQFQRVQSSYLKGAAGYLLVMDMTRESTLEKAKEIQARIQQESGPLPFIVLVNKSDLESEREIQESDLDALRDHGWTVFSTSAKTGAHVEEAFEELAKAMV